MEKSLSWRIYVYIGITPLCLYNSPLDPDLQDGIFHKIPERYPCKWENFPACAQLLLTQRLACGMLNMLGRLKSRPVFYFLAHRRYT